MIAAVVILAIAHIVTGVAVAILAVKANQIESTDAGIAAGLRAAAAFAGMSILFGLIVMISGFVVLAARGCKRRPIVFVIFLILLIISYIISLTLAYVYSNKYEAIGDESTVRDLRSAFYLIIAGIILQIVSFIIFYSVIGKKAAKIGKFCRKVNKQGEKAGFNLSQVK